MVPPAGLAPGGLGTVALPAGLAPGWTARWRSPAGLASKAARGGADRGGCRQTAEFDRAGAVVRVSAGPGEPRHCIPRVPHSAIPVPQAAWPEVPGFVRPRSAVRFGGADRA
jgi:hypothetical protein